MVVDKLTEAGEIKIVICSFFLDLAKAFNTVYHEILRVATLPGKTWNFRNFEKNLEKPGILN